MSQSSKQMHIDESYNYLKIIKLKGFHIHLSIFPPGKERDKDCTFSHNNYLLSNPPLLMEIHLRLN